MTTIQIFRNSDETVDFVAGQNVFEFGQPGDVMFGVVEGEVEVHYEGKRLEVVGPGGIFGELALIDHSPRSATATAKTDCRLVAVNEKRFAFLVQQTPFFALQVMRVMAERLRRESTD